MDLDDISIEVRDRNLTLVGRLLDGFTLEVLPLQNKVGSWTLTLPSDHPLAHALRTPGSGILVSGPDEVFISGPTNAPGRSVTGSDPGDTITITGVCDNQWIADRLASPDPAWSGEGEIASDYDTRTGPPETVIHGFVDSNAGPGATDDRQVPSLTMGANLGRGGDNVTKAARWDALDELITGVATAAEMSWRVVQRGNALRFETSTSADLTGTVRLDTRYGTLAGYKLAVTAPTATHAIVGAQDVDDDRIFATVTTEGSDAASVAWGRRIERFVNQTYTDDVDEWTATARELLADEGLTVTSMQAIPNDDDNMRFGRDYRLGDKVCIVADDGEYAAIITGAVLKVDNAGVRVALVLGDATAFNRNLATQSKLSSVASRVSSLERNAGLSVTDAVDVPPFTTTFTAANPWVCNHNFHQKPREVRVIVDGVEVEADVTNPSDDQTIIAFWSNQTGSVEIFK